VLESAVHGADAVLSGLGPRSAADAGITARARRPSSGRCRPPACGAWWWSAPSRLARCRRPAIPSPTAQPRRRVLHVAPVQPCRQGGVPPALRRLALMEGLLCDSGLDWTVVRPPRLTDKPLSGGYRTAYGQNVRGGWQLSRADVAHLITRSISPGCCRSSARWATAAASPGSVSLTPVPRMWIGSWPMTRAFEQVCLAYDVHSTRSFPGEQSPVIGPGETGAPARRHLLGGLHQRQGRAWVQRGRRRRAARRLRQSDVAA
jgi:hypothetical protein